MATARKDPTAEAFRRDRTRNLNIQEVRFPANMDMASLTEALRRMQNAIWISIRKLNEAQIKSVSQIEVVVQSGSNSILHGLGAKPNGWRVLKALDGFPSLFVTSANWAARNEFEILMEGDTDNVTVTLEFFL